MDGHRSRSNTFGGRGHGDHLIHLDVGVPKKLDRKHEEMLREIASDLGLEVSAEKKGILGGLFGKKK